MSDVNVGVIFKSYEPLKPLLAKPFLMRLPVGVPVILQF